MPDLLSRLEDKELRLLAWGVVDGFLSQSEVEDAIDVQLDKDAEEIEAELATVEEYLDYLLNHNLLHRLPESTPKYRTRLGETMRLLRYLRQLFPQKDTSSPGWWRHSRTLVADYRIKVGPRRYPRRETTPKAAIEELRSLTGWTDRHSDVFLRLVGNNKLARFQIHATESILSALGEPQLTGRIVTSGTGSGKTLAFYIPALLDIAATHGQKRSGPHTLALYPRNELLRDQAREALRVVIDLGPLNARPGGRSARIGLLYGQTPHARDLDSDHDWRAWKRRSYGWSAPYFPCLTENCQGSLVWSDTDRAAGRERLACSTCSFNTLPGTIALTRESMEKDPPDILFSSTEMLSQQSTNLRLAPLLGWKGPNGTKMVLLDEVHTYTGVHGAQVALMLRRWRHANRQWGVDSPIMVGLSATLRDAGDFFAALTGAERHYVEVIAPSPDELLPISREYGIVLRGDPVSGSPLLSTTIQTAMLLGRVLDTNPGIYGSVSFAFTDDLDVINRLYDNLRDAEGAQPRGRMAGEVLADLRSPAGPQSGARYPDGQSWDMPYRLQRMNQPLRIARTSSQDSGVDTSADVIVATSSLEVGFNDPRVGAVIQHKAPRDLASFLQRRGRAGRRLEMRPLTVVVLSDYGRDRIAYQTYEKLLDPEIDTRSLPINNRFVVKMQATHSLLDWIARKTGADVRSVLSPPWRGKVPWKTAQVISVLRAVLSESQTQLELADHLRRSMALPADEVSAALWEEPRSLILSVVPTALRRLEAEWTTIPDEVDPGAKDRKPLPEFMSDTLFASLNTPDVLFELPTNFGEDSPRMPIMQALREAVPGRVSRRFGHAHASLSTWLPVPDNDSGLELTDVIAAGHGLGIWDTPAGEQYTVVRPLALRLCSPPPDITDSSSAMPLWRSAFDYVDEALHHVDIPTPSIWATLVGTCAFALHLGGGPLKVRRMAIGSDGELAYLAGQRTPVHVRYEHDGAPAAIGFELEVDAMVVTGRLSAGGPSFLKGFTSSPPWRTLAFRSRVLEDERLDDLANVFQREWLSSVYLEAFVARGLGGSPVEVIPDQLAGGIWAINLPEFLAVAYRTDGQDEDESRMQRTLAELATDPLVRTVIEDHGRLLGVDELRVETGDLLDRVFLDTFANALLAAVSESLSDANEADLACDVEFDENTRAYRIFVSETAIGGLGLIESLHREYGLDPRRFWDAVARACSPTDAEEVDESMREALANLVTPGSDFSTAVAEFRSAEGVAAMDYSLERVRAIWTESDGPPDHLLISTFAARFMRPGSRPEIDRVVSDLATAWVDLEARLGVEIDARTIAYHASQGRLGIDLKSLSVDSVFSLLWLRGAQARSQRLNHWHPYRRNVVIERLMLNEAVRDGAAIIDVTEPGWLDDYARAIGGDARVLLTAPYPRRADLAQALREVTTRPIERGGLRVFGRLKAISQRRGQMTAAVSLAEELQ
ncbi:DEAD/DEAH box helicase [Rhodococcus sp. ARC_M12]|uniref:protein DpdJ n=1 Tax=Rhodococcus sp. ARC_M12 TaxID=2928854 RepID=UPI001FB2115C|nr:protein DpdJ [Rhodococcus sp. ARC_M12]MCJ0978709.1 DEAD/DEAH box helicase [Rhodococcus sp. ARC_M12]